MPRERIFSSRNSSMRLGFRTALVSWNRNDLFAEPPPLAMKRNLYSGLASARAGGRVELDLRRQVGAGVLLLPHGQRGELGVAQVQLGVGVVHALADPLAVVGPGEHALGLLAHHDRGAGVLAHREHAAGGDVDVLQQVQRDEPVVAAGLRVVDDPAQLGEVRGPQEVRDVVHGLGGQQLQRGRVDLEERPAVHLEGADPLGAQQAVGRLVAPRRQQVGVAELSVGTHRANLTSSRGNGHTERSRPG